MNQEPHVSLLTLLSFVPSTIKKIEKLQKLMDCSTKIDTIVKAVAIATTIMKAMRNGNMVVIEMPNGKRTKIVV